MPFDFTSRDEKLGVLGSIPPPTDPWATAQTLKEASRDAYAHIARFPDESFYIIDSEGRVYEIVSCPRHHDIVNAGSKSLFVAWACFGLATVGLIASGLCDLGIVGLVFSAIAIATYLLAVKTEIFNEVESLVVSVIIGTLGTMLLPVAIAILRT